MIIGLVGKQGAGKDVVGDYLVANHAYFKTAFANPIKNKICEMLNITLEEYDVFKRSMWASTSSLNSFIGRELVVGVGAIMREVNENRFIEYVNENLTENTVITDVRFENELDYIESVGGVILKIERPGIKEFKHHTECIADREFEHVISNNSTLHSLYKQIDGFLNE